MRIQLMTRRSAAVLSAVLACAVIGGTAHGATSAPQLAASVAANAYERGPAPTEESVRAPRGTFAVASVTIARSQVTGFGGGTIYYPTDTSQGTYGGIAVVPGYTSPESAIAWLGPHLASRGFVVMTMATINTQDQPTSRGNQLLAALDYLTRNSPTQVRQRLDSTRLGVMGHSMGGGGTLYAESVRKTIKAGVPLAPYNQDKTWESITTPTLLLAGTADNVAGITQHARPMYNSMTSARERGLINVTGADHGTFTREHPVIGKFTEAWMKRFIDNDTRYTQFLCPATTGNGVSEFRATCPMS
ncbi:alpha/beta hydrolase family protein [Amycolatopsis sp. cmx-11-51]|uniref:alpha/beta hydrolase family protein n=1 Tax=unclassified Amycolatopsis TaxID=2618356 RepID=UPI0039E460AC